MEAAPPWGPGPPASAAPWEEASGALGPGPLSAQARTLLDPPLIPIPIPGIRPTLLRPTDQPHSAGFPILRHSRR